MIGSKSGRLNVVSSQWSARSGPLATYGAAHSGPGRLSRCFGSHIVGLLRGELTVWSARSAQLAIDIGFLAVVRSQ